MKIAVAQLNCEAGKIDANMRKHLDLITSASHQQADFIVFPELSLMGYAPELAASLAVDHAGAQVQFAALKQASEAHQIKVCVGMATRGHHKPRISALIFSPKQTLQIYSKQILHRDEYPYFEAGTQPGVVSWQGKRVALGICYESLQDKHLQQSVALNVDVYVAMVAKHEQGLASALPYWAQAAQQHQLAIAMANSTGSGGDFVTCGQSAIWDRRGQIVEQLGTEENGLIVFTF